MSITYRTWHRAYCRWYDAHYGGRPRAAAVWGWIADRVVYATNMLVRLGVPVERS